MRQAGFLAPKVGLLFGRFSLGPPFEESQKMADLGVFAKLARTRLCGHFWRRGFRTTVWSFGVAVCTKALSDDCSLSA